MTTTTTTTYCVRQNDLDHGNPTINVTCSSASNHQEDISQPVVRAVEVTLFSFFPPLVPLPQIHRLHSDISQKA